MIKYYEINLQYHMYMIGLKYGIIKLKYSENLLNNSKS